MLNDVHDICIDAFSFLSLRVCAFVPQFNLFRKLFPRSSRISRTKAGPYYVLHLGRSSGEPYWRDTPRGDTCYAKEMP